MNNYSTIFEKINKETKVTHKKLLRQARCLYELVIKIKIIFLKKFRINTQLLRKEGENKCM